MLGKNRALIVLIILSLLLGLCACSGSNQTQSPPAANEPSTQTAPPAQGNTQKVTTENQDSQLNISVADDVGKSAALPEGYPSDLFPIYKDSYIISAVELEGSYTISALSKDDFKEVAAFYKEVLANATVTMETDSDAGFTSLGTIDDYTYNFDAGANSETEGYASSITIMLMPAK